VISVRENLYRMNPSAQIIEAASPLFVNDPDAIRGRRVLVVEDGPTLTHGEMAYGAGWVAARRFGAVEIVDPRPFAVGTIKATYQKYSRTGQILPAMGYGDEMVHDLEETINNSDVDLVISATPIDLSRIIKVNKPIQRVRYELQEIGQPTLMDLLKRNSVLKINMPCEERFCRPLLLFYGIIDSPCSLMKHPLLFVPEKVGMG